ncbi:hypothetical protein E3T55_14785 [Cryobacterium frigoriphilum]|uniref:DUF6286 domain-containing protein n=1 Tax=Cryobacterium frigoriphilum TaxID=1259150 RepID=A0A4R8ZWC8_9MICO|nr:DUF6286 domain-containing protein [Cryobacterium frigoriphilum]TFD47817.1 hypothetical protein E3T55_14785 [Cryobacterium frigoriphilum]
MKTAPATPAMTPAARDRRVLRRETHSSRSGLAITVALLIIVVCLIVGTEMVLQLLGRAPLLFSPTDAARTAAAPASDLRRVMVPLGIGVALVGLLLLLAAVLPGRRTRHGLSTDRLAVVVDDEVIASALARSAAIAAGVAPDAVRVTVGRRSAQVRLTPTSGIRVDEARVTEAAVSALERVGPRPSIRPRLLVAPTGRVGS